MCVISRLPSSFQLAILTTISQSDNRLKYRDYLGVGVGLGFSFLFPSSLRAFWVSRAVSEQPQGDFNFTLTFQSNSSSFRAVSGQLQSYFGANLAQISVNNFQTIQVGFKVSFEVDVQKEKRMN